MRKLQVTRDGDTVSFGEESRENLISYNCGIKF